MKFEIGYQLPREGSEPLVQVVRDYLPRVAEVYFAWVGAPSGRAPLPEEGREQLEEDLKTLRGMGVRLNLLFNASCYGPAAFSRSLAEEAAGIVEHLQGLVGLDCVTTMSPMIARTIRGRFPSVRVRASVNMRLGTVQAFEYVADVFDDFTMQREYNRDPARIEELSAWCRREGRSLHILANSGCLAWCAVQGFHDNLVAHEAELNEDDCLAGHIPGSCWDLYRGRANCVRFLQNTWVRPEDVHHYERWFPQMKLATRMHSQPRRVIRAYAEGRFAGNLADLLEPGHAAAFAPFVFDNSRFPADWFDRVTRPGPPKEMAEWYADVLRGVLVDTRAAS